MAKGMIDENHPLSLGCIERACRQVQRRLLRSSDLIVGIGYDTVEVEYEAWIDDVPLLQIDIEPADVAPSVKLIDQVTGDLDASLARLAALPAMRNSWTWRRSPIIAAHSKQHCVRPQRRSRHMPPSMRYGMRCRPEAFSLSTSALIPPIGSQWVAHSPQSFLITNGWSSMGFGLPAAIAAKLARPDLPVVCLIGDGCFQMTCGEVATANGSESRCRSSCSTTAGSRSSASSRSAASFRSTAPTCRRRIIAIRLRTISACLPSACAAPRRWKQP